MEESLPDILLIEGRQLCLFGDSGCAERIYLKVPFSGSSLTANQRGYNKSISSVRVSVEWYFMDVKLYFSTADYKRKLRILQLLVSKFYIVATMLTNQQNFLYHNQISTFFKCAAPSLQEYVERHGTDR